MSKIFTEAPLGIRFVIGRPNNKKMQPVIKTKGLQSVTCDCWGVRCSRIYIDIKKMYKTREIT